MIRPYRIVSYHCFIQIHIIQYLLRKSVVSKILSFTELRFRDNRCYIRCSTVNDEMTLTRKKGSETSLLFTYKGRLRKCYDPFYKVLSQFQVNEKSRYSNFKCTSFYENLFCFSYQSTLWIEKSVKVYSNYWQSNESWTMYDQMQGFICVCSNISFPRN